MDAAPLVELAERTARAAGALLLDHADRAPAGVETKSTSTDMVSDADRAAERLIVDAILAARPDDGILGEEGTGRDGTSGVSWIVDPLDGTTNYLYRLPLWCVSVACADGAGMVAGCVFHPPSGECFVARRGGGSLLDGRPVRASRLDDPARALVGTGFGYEPGRRVRQAAVLHDVIGRVRDVRRGGSAALDLAWTACGRLDAFYETGIQPWDYAAGVLLVEEAGGTVTRRRDDGDTADRVVAGPRAVHDLLLQHTALDDRR